tara:strand:- start:1057 stop:1251 length:195 start_codon:yes stop_codon:yes gene_type:complete
MPIYEFKCQQCKDQFEVLVRTKTEEIACPVCKSGRVTKLVSGGGFILKGGGWYADGYSKGKEGE